MLGFFKSSPELSLHFQEAHDDFAEFIRDSSKTSLGDGSERLYGTLTHAYNNLTNSINLIISLNAA